MTFFESVKGTVCTAVGTIASVTQDLVEKNRTNAKLNRLRLVMKNESELMNRAYIALGKGCYEKAKKGEEMPLEQKQKLIDVIDVSKAKIAKARECYRKIVDSQNDIFYGTTEAAPEYDKNEVVDITVACSNENEYSSSPFPEAPAEEKAVEEAKEAAPLEEKSSAAEEIFGTADSDNETEENEVF